MHEGTTANDSCRQLLYSMPCCAVRASGDNDVAREIAVLKKLDHPNIVKLAEVSLFQGPVTQESSQHVALCAIQGA